MNSQDLLDLQKYQTRVRPMQRQLYRKAFAITGNRELAEFAMQDALIEYFNHREEAPIKGGLPKVVKQCALSELRAARKEGEIPEEWDGIFVPSGENGGQKLDYLLAVLANEPHNVRRILTLFYGCKLSFNEVAEVMEMRRFEVKQLLNQVLTRASRSIEGQATHPQRGGA